MKSPGMRLKLQNSVAFPFYHSLLKTVHKSSEPWHVPHKTGLQNMGEKKCRANTAKQYTHNYMNVSCNETKQVGYPPLEHLKPL